ncbi:fucose 4-O-acetylase [Photobacterium jeanii]|uniref:Fucose 4-O-acetylase n=1 Tax=Photobacterium jeanii TaxID=858640 RepID=A0A178KNJ5_9GAMM|nr:fucose 4-O-acetylase [Photobacterium jeanii]
MASFEWGRMIALFAIIMIHCSVFYTTPVFDDVPWFALLLNQLSRFAVPLFFLIAGYLIAPKLLATPFPTVKRYSQTLLKVWLAWSLIYLIAPFNLKVLSENGYLAERMGYWQYLLQQPLNSVFEGGMVHLWYIPGLVCAVTVIAGFIHLKQTQWLLPSLIALYLYGLMAGSYQPIFELSAPIFTRNGPFFSGLMVAIGFYIQHQEWRLSPLIAGCLAVTGMGMHLGEAFMLTHYDVPFNTHDFLLGTPLWAVGIFMLLLAFPQFGAKSSVTSYSKDVLGVYLVHMLIVIYLFNLSLLLNWQGSWVGLSAVPVTFIISMGITKLIEKTPLRTLLLR